MMFVDLETRPRPRQFSGWNPIGMVSLMRREAMRQLHWFGMAIIGPAIQAALFASVFTLAAGSALDSQGFDFLSFLGAGLVISALIQRAFETTGYSIMFDKMEGDGLQDILGAPLNAMEILTAYLVAAICTGVVIGICIWLVMALFGLGLPHHPFAALFFMVIAAGISSLLGLIAAIYSKKWDGFAGKETFTLLPVVFLSGTFFPKAALPEGIWQTFFQMNPVYYIVDGFRWAATGRLESDPLVGATVTLALFALSFLIAAYLITTGRKIKP